MVEIEKNNSEGHPAKKNVRRPRDLTIYKSWCKQCGICMAFCPTGALEKGPDGCPVWAHPEQCVGCRMCEFRCPDFAIEVLTSKEAGHAPQE